MKRCPVCDRPISDNKEFCSTACELENEELEDEEEKVTFQKIRKQEKKEK